MDDDDVRVHPDLLDLKRMLKALGDVVRLELVAMLAATDELTVTDLGHMLATNGHLISQPLISWHISVLRRWGLVRTRRTGRLVYCSLDRARFDQCLSLLAGLAGRDAPIAMSRAATAAAQQPDTATSSRP